MTYNQLSPILLQHQGKGKNWGLLFDQKDKERIIEDGSILHDGLLRTGNLHHIVESLVQKVNLKIELPQVAVVLGTIGLLKYLEAAAQIWQSLAGSILFECLLLGNCPQNRLLQFALFKAMAAAAISSFVG